VTESWPHDGVSFVLCISGFVAIFNVIYENNCMTIDWQYTAQFPMDKRDAFVMPAKLQVKAQSLGRLALA